MDFSNALKKVEKRWDFKIWKNSSYIISKKIEDLKKASILFKFQNINAFIKKFGNKVVVKIILNNSWLIDFDKKQKELKRIFGYMIEIS